MLNLIDEFKMYFPVIAEKVDSYKVKPFNVLVGDIEGSKFVYDSSDKSFLFLKYENGEILEESWKAYVSFMIRKILVYKCMDQKDLAEATGISTAAISRYITKNRIPNIFVIAKIANALDVSIDDLINI